MRKRTAIFSTVALLACLAVLVYFLQRGRQNLLTDPYKAISRDAAVVIETVDLQSFINSLSTAKGIFGEAGRIRDFGLFYGKIKYLADQFNNPVYKKLGNNGSAIISFHVSPTRKLVPLLSMAVSPEIRLRHLRDVLRQSGIRTGTEIRIGGYPVIEVPYLTDKQKDTVFVSVLSGLLVCSSSKTVITGAILQTAREDDIRSQPGFSRILQASGKNEDKIFVVFRNLQGLLKPLFREGYPSYISDITRLASCAGGDIYLNENGLVLSGYTESLDPAEALYKFKSGIPGTFHTYRILPSSTVLFESLNRKAVTVSQKPSDPVSAPLVSRLRDYLGDEITRAVIEIKDRPLDENTLIIYELKNRVFAEKIFLDEISSGITKDNIYFFRPDDQINIPVYLTGFGGFASAVIPGFIKESGFNWFAFYDNFLISGKSYVTISRLLYDNLLNKTLGNDLAYRDFEGSMPSIGGYYFYCVPSRITDYLSKFISDDYIRILKTNLASLSKIPGIGYQLVSSNDMIFSTISVKFREEALEESTTEWETLLDTVAAVKPFFFTNHLTGAKEIFIQDFNNNVYLINAAGRILWKVPLRERITGSIYMIDYFRNGKYQMLFSGKNYLHLLDRNGNYVERYPVRLRSPATNSLALFDYDNNRNYRLLIAGEDNLIYAYDNSGNVVKGWKPFRTNGTVSSEISWFRVSGKDYIVAADRASLYFLDRTGNARLTLKEPVTKADKSAIRLISGSPPSLICTAPDGTIQQIFFDGSVMKSSLRKFSGDHSFDIFDVNGDGFGEYVFIDRGMLYLYNHNRTEVFSRKFSSEEIGGPINFVFSATDRKIGVFDIKQKLIYLIDRNGETMNGFPLKGASMFSIGKLSEKNEWHLIVGGTDRFLYNYKLETAIN